DTNNINQLLYQGDIGTSVEASIDHRFFSEEGKESIKEDFHKSENLIGAVKDVIQEDKLQASDFFDHVINLEINYEVSKEFALIENGKYAKMLNDVDSLTDEQLQQTVTAYVEVYANQHGITIEEALVTVLDDIVKKGDTTYEKPQGAHVKNDDGSSTVTIDANNNKNTLDYANTVIHEGTHASSYQYESTYTSESMSTESYADLLGKYAKDDFSFVYSNLGYGSVNTNDIKKEFSGSQIFQDNTNWLMDKIINEPEKVEFRKLSQQETAYINYAAEDYAKSNGITKEEAIEQLITAAKYHVDKRAQNIFNEGTALSEASNMEESKSIFDINSRETDIQEAYNYLIKISETEYPLIDMHEEKFTLQPMFATTPEQFKNSYWDIDNAIGLQDVTLDTLLLFVPVKVGTGSKIDDVGQGAIGNVRTVDGGEVGKNSDTVVIGRVRDLQDLASGERSLLDQLPNLGNPKANWYQNSEVLRKEMQKSLPIRDASVGDTAGQFLNAERNLLKNHGWTFDENTNYWMPPK
ncbi:MAG: hypothetical protein LBJ88_03900, partial [Campylobacteraceae bacterium]|nr:hypothetical protein [Campylobacteraceae bacterium]